RAQLRACMMALEHGVPVIPVWNKSNREHLTIGSEPATARRAADAAVKQLRWQEPYHVDADHIRIETVDRFLAHADFYTIDVADSIGQSAPSEAIQAFTRRHAELGGRILIPGIQQPLVTTPADLERIARQYLLAVEEAGKI